VSTRRLADRRFARCAALQAERGRQAATPIAPQSSSQRISVTEIN
jgi:hypothetical protein